MKHISQEIVAHHEAGHAVACAALGIRIIRVTIDTRRTGNFGGIFGKLAGETTAKEGRTTSLIMMAFAGQIAEQLLMGNQLRRRFSSDEVLACKYARRICGNDNEELHAYLRWLYIRAKRMCCQPEFQTQVKALAGELLKTTTISGRRALKIIAQASGVLQAEEFLEKLKACAGRREQRTPGGV